MQRDNNPRRLHPSHFTAKVSLHSTPSAFISFYENAVDKLFREVSEGNETPDIIAMPLLFLMRHTLELGYKNTITEICKITGATYNQKEDLHFLQKHHRRLKQEFVKLWESGGVSDNKKAGFDDYYSLTQESMAWFDKIDHAATNFRYPSSNFIQNESVNLLEVKTKFDQAMTLLAVTVDVITDGIHL